MHDPHHNKPIGDTNYEPSDAHVMPILVLGAILVVGTAASFLAGYILLKYSTERPSASNFVPSPLDTERQPWATAGGVRLQEDPVLAWNEYFSTKSTDPHRYGVVSDQPEIYHFPVEQAIEFVAANGLPVFVPFGDGSIEALAEPQPHAEPVDGQVDSQLD